MKLVDILARELKVWPDQYYQIYQDSGGNLIGTLSNNDLEDCDSEDLPYDPVTIAWDGSSEIVGRSEWQAAVDALYPKQAVTEEWNGEGLPPVGTVCELRFPEVQGSSWRQVTILLLGDQKIFYRDEAGDEWANLPDDVELRPIRTPEQIAAEECDKAVKAMLAEFEHTGSLTSHYEVCEVLHKAGYRKQVVP